MALAARSGEGLSDAIVEAQAAWSLAVNPSLSVSGSTGKEQRLSMCVLVTSIALHLQLIDARSTLPAFYAMHLMLCVEKVGRGPTT